MNGQITRVEDRPLRQVGSVRELLVNRQAQSQLATVAAKHMNPERMMRVVANAIRTTPQLQEAEPMSLLGALMTCASLGLEPNTPLGHAYLIPFRRKKKDAEGRWQSITEAQLIIGYKGFADLARRSGQVINLHADVVYDDDHEFSYEYGSNQHLRHRPGPRKGQMLGAYCYVRLKEGEGHVYMTRDEILAVRDKSQGWQTAKQFDKTAQSPWVVHEPRMWAKTALRRLANSGELPMSIEFLNAYQVDDAPADYRAFAMDPTIGIDGAAAGEEAAADDLGDVVEETRQIEAERVERARFDERPVHADTQAQAGPATEARARQRAQERPVEPDKGGPAPEPRRGAAAPAQEVPARDQGALNVTTYNRVIAAAMDDEPVWRILAREKAAIAEIERTDPSLHSALMEELATFGPAEDPGGDDGQSRMPV